MSDIILTNLSKLRDSEEHTYSSDIGSIKGVNTNDAPVKYLMSLIASKGRKAEKIIAVTTKEANTAYDEFCSMIDEFGRSTCNYINVPVKAEAGDNSFAETIDFILGNINAGDSVWIDTTGGFRNSIYLLMAVVRVLEYSGIKVEKAIYSNFERHEIEDITATYHMFDLINAANSFTSFGNSDELIQFFSNCKNEAVKNVVGAMNEFSEAVALCRTSGLDSILERLNNGLSLLGSTSPSSEGEILFRSLADIIRKKFNIGSKVKIDYSDIILWCVQNKMIQQAVTVYTEKCGEYLYNRCFTASGETLEKTKQDKLSHENLYYRLFYTGLMNMETTPLGQLLKKSLKDNSLRRAILSSMNVEQLPPGAVSAEEKRDLKKIFKLRHIMYNQKGERLKNEYIEKNFSKYPEMKKFGRITANNFEGFLNVLYSIKNSSWLKEFYSGKPDVMQYSESRLNTIERLESAYNGQDEYTLHISVSKMQHIMRDYLYIKNWLRNAVNHASDDHEQSEEMKNYFKKYGYLTDEAPSLNDVIEIIKNAVYRLKGEDT